MSTKGGYIAGHISGGGVKDTIVDIAVVPDDGGNANHNGHSYSEAMEVLDGFRTG